MIFVYLCVVYLQQKVNAPTNFYLPLPESGYQYITDIIISFKSADTVEVSDLRVIACYLIIGKMIILLV